MRTSACAVVLAASFVIACGKSPQGYQRHSYSTRNMPSSTGDVKIPVGLWEKIEAVHIVEGGGPSKAAGKDEVHTEFMPVKVFLIEKNRGILGGRNHELLFGEGGGEIDLKDFAGAQKGTFYIAFEALVEGNEHPPRVFYLSNAVRRQVGRDAMGAGCKGYYEITSSFAKAMKTDGYQVNTTAARHVSALAGAYFFAISRAGKLHLAQVTIKDSRYRALHCRR